MKREPTEEEVKQISNAIFGSECGLTEAQDFVRTLTADLQESNPASFVRKKQGKSHWVRLSNR